MFADIFCFCALYEANLFLYPEDFTGRQPLYLYLGGRTNMFWVIRPPLQFVVCVRTRGGSQVPGNRISRACLSAFPYLTLIFLRLERILPLTKCTGWCKWSPEMLWAPSTAKNCRHLFHLLLFLCAPLCPCFGFCLAGKFPRFKTAGEEMFPSKHTRT